MEIMQAVCSRICTPFHCSKLNSSVSIPILSAPLPLTSITPAPLSLNSSRRKLLTTSYAPLDDAFSGSAVKTVGIDPMLDVKKKALDLSDGLKGTSIYLVGINSNIKTRLGKLLASALRYYFFDSDSLIVEAAGGEAAAKQYLDTDATGFRETETEVLKQLSSMGRLVVSAGNGAVQSATNLSLLRHGISIWVDVPPDMIAKEAVEDGFPLAAWETSTSASQSEVLSQLTALYQEMQEGYAIADATVSLQKVACLMGYDDVKSVTAEDMGLEVLTEIEKLIRVKKMMEDAARPF